MADDNKKRKPGRPPGSKNKTALVRLDKAVAVLAPQVAALKAEDKLHTLGKDRLAELDEWAYGISLNTWEKSPPSNTRCSNPLRERRSELPNLTDSTPTSLWTHSSATV